MASDDLPTDPAEQAALAGDNDMASRLLADTAASRAKAAEAPVELANTTPRMPPQYQAVQPPPPPPLDPVVRGGDPGDVIPNSVMREAAEDWIQRQAPPPAKPGDTCPDCNGAGVRSYRHAGIIIDHAMCNECGGTGKVA